MRKIKILLVLLTLFALPNMVSASTERTTQLDLSSMDLTADQEDASEGWKWDAASSTLTLTEVNINVVGKQAILLPRGKDITINLVGNNKISSSPSSSEPSSSLIKAIATEGAANKKGTITIAGSGSIEIVVTGNWPAIDSATSSLKITSGKIKITGGSITTMQTVDISGGELTIDTSNAVDSQGIYANGSVSISNGKVDINAGDIGIYIPGIGAEEIITGINITGGKIDINAPVAAIYVGDTGITKNVIVDGSTLNFKDSDFGIYSYRGTITITKKTTFIAKKGATLYGFHRDNDIRKLIIDSADYTNVDNKLASIPSDLSKYTDETVTALNNVKSSISRDKNFLQQSIVDGYVTALENAINNLKIKTFDITTSINANGVATLENPTNVEYGSTRELNVTTEVGYEVKSIKINGVDKISELTNGKLILSNITSNLEIIVETAPIKYEFVSGKDATYDGKELTFKLNGLYSLFDKLYINGNELSKDNYTVVEGSTIITLKNEYLKTLSANKYKLKATYTNGTSDETTFTIKAVENNSEKNTTTNSTENNSEKNTTTNSTENNSEKNTTVSSVKNPNTLDNILLYLGICLISVIGITSTGLYLKKNQTNK